MFRHLTPFRLVIAVWMLIGADVLVLALTMSPTDAEFDYTHLAWFAFSIECMWFVSGIALAMVLLIRRLTR